MTRKELNQLIRDGKIHDHDKIIVHKDGSIEVRRVYFYRHGMTANKFAESVQAEFDSAGILVECFECGDEFKGWPSDSYFWVRLTFMKTQPATPTIN